MPQLDQSLLQVQPGQTTPLLRTPQVPSIGGIGDSLANLAAAVVEDGRDSKAHDIVDQYRRDRAFLNTQAKIDHTDPVQYDQAVRTQAQTLKETYRKLARESGVEKRFEAAFNQFESQFVDDEINHFAGLHRNFLSRAFNKAKDSAADVMSEAQFSFEFDQSFSETDLVGSDSKKAIKGKNTFTDIDENLLVLDSPPAIKVSIENQEYISLAMNESARIIYKNALKLTGSDAKATEALKQHVQEMKDVLLTNMISQNPYAFHVQGAKLVKQLQFDLPIGVDRGGNVMTQQFKLKGEELRAWQDVAIKEINKQQSIAAGLAKEKKQILDLQQDAAMLNVTKLFTETPDKGPLLDKLLSNAGRKELNLTPENALKMHGQLLELAKQGPVLFTNHEEVGQLMARLRVHDESVTWDEVREGLVHISADDQNRVLNDFRSLKERQATEAEEFAQDQLKVYNDLFQADGIIAFLKKPARVNALVSAKSVLISSRVSKLDQNDPDYRAKVVDIVREETINTIATLKRDKVGTGLSKAFRKLVPHDALENEEIETIQEQYYTGQITSETAAQAIYYKSLIEAASQFGKNPSTGQIKKTITRGRLDLKGLEPGILSHRRRTLFPSISPPAPVEETEAGIKVTGSNASDVKEKK